MVCFSLHIEALSFQQVVQLGEDVYATDLHWFPKSIGGKKQGGSEVYALTLTDGKKFLSQDFLGDDNFITFS